jgi:hypothetical protein
MAYSKLVLNAVGQLVKEDRQLGKLLEMPRTKNTRRSKRPRANALTALITLQWPRGKRILPA